MLTVDSRLVVLLLMGRASFISEATLFQTILWAVLIFGRYKASTCQTVSAA